MSANKKDVKEELDEVVEEIPSVDVDGDEETTVSEDNIVDEESGDEENEAVGDEETVTVEDELIAALKKVDENWDQFLRTKAEMENLRRRNQKDVENAHKYGLEKFVNELLPIKESMELGLVYEDATVESLFKGMQMNMDMLNTVFENLAVEEISPKGEKFDAELHQAMTMQPTDEVEPNTVLEVLQKGYRLNGRMIRPAMVIVSKAAE